MSPKGHSIADGRTFGPRNRIRNGTYEAGNGLPANNFEARSCAGSWRECRRLSRESFAIPND